MLAYNATPDYDAQPGAKLQPKRPTQFMFIDSSHGGVNAKPDKTVRSFVMKSARTKKSWSTRPKSPNKGSSSDTKTKRRPSVEAHSLRAPDITVEELSQFAAQHVSTDGWCTMSPKSAYSDSVMSCSSSDYVYGQSTSDTATPNTEYGYIDCSYNIHTPQQEMSLSQVSLTARFEFFDCLPVRLDRSSQGQLHQCKLHDITFN